ncbi:phosphofurin acidic cluster sorting protein 2-like isoform X2 [Acanthaster planci]|uniref:Phosphofurin acidic cluster sorting protein 2-like isoform X2 n=1 Tax=Acanthaster planci TaxID=133434 RepID=A0A8B7YCN5_ACAPL|nr:phosphofurin acidic cluster sorting protein 2-like isoform X2 [Acanthaster planci]
MADKSWGKTNASSASQGNKPVPMKLFSTWEVERTAPNCIPRLCTLRLTHLVVLKTLETDLGSVIIAVRMQSSKRTLRSNEIFFSQGSLLDTDLDLSFSLQYPHFLKRDGNKLRIMLQRRKRYKNRTILGYKTLAVGLINMSEVLQQSKDNELSLYGKEHGMERVAHVTVIGLSSQPVDQFKRGIDRSPDIDNETEDEEESYSSDQENSDSGENLPEGQDLLGEEEQEPGRKGLRTKMRPPMNRQRNFKQKFIALLKKFKVQSDDSDTEQYPYEDQDRNQIDPDFLLYNDLDDLNLSDSGPDVDQDDEMSIGSTPKPVLRPFFSQGIPTSSSMAEEMEQFPLIDQCYEDNGNSKDSGSSGEFPGDDETTPMSEMLPSLVNRSESTLSHQSDPGDMPIMMKTTPSPGSEKAMLPSATNGAGQKEKRLHSHSVPKTLSKEGSQGSQGSPTEGPRQHSKSVEKASSFGKADHKHPGVTPLAEQLTSLWQGLTDSQIPDRVILVSVLEKHGRVLAKTLTNAGEKVVCTCNHSDVEATLQFIVNKLQKYCNQNPKIPEPLKVALCGNESYVGAVLRPYVELFSAKTADWQNYVSFYVVPLGTGSCSLAKYLGSLDSRYSSLFLDSNWKEFFDRDYPDNQPHMKPRRTRNAAYAKEMVNRVSQYLAGSQHRLQLPVGEVMVTCKLRSTDEESIQKFIPFINNVRIGPADGVSFSLSEGEDTSPGTSGGLLSSSPPGGASNRDRDVAGSSTPPSSPVVVNNSASPVSGELMDLQVEYWPMLGGKKDKSSLKTAFRSLTVQRLPSHADPSTTGLSMVIVTKEKNKKIMRIGKKPREIETALKSQEIDGIHRLVCTSRSQDYSLKVSIDGIELTRVKFFQLSAQWQTRIKHFPVALFAQDLPAC